MDGCPRLDPRADVVERGRARQIDALEIQASGDEMEMRVVEAGQHRRAARVDHRRLRAAEARDFTLAADAKNLVATDGDGLRHRAARTRRIHFRVVDDHVNGTIRVVPLGSDNQPGDERRRDDSNNDIGGQAGSH